MDTCAGRTPLLLGMTALVISAGMVGCGSDANPITPTTPSPTPISSPPVARRITFSLNAEADHFLFSTALARLAAGDALELAFTAQQVNTAPNEQFGHSVEFWLLRTGNPNVSDLSGEGVALSLLWAGNIAWVVTSRLPGPGFASTSIRLQIPFAEQRMVRVSHRSDGRAEFAVDGRAVLTLERPAAEDQVFARVVGARADFSYEERIVASGGASLASGRAMSGQCVLLPLCR